MSELQEMLRHVQLGLSEYDSQNYEGAKEHFRSALLMLQASPSTYNDEVNDLQKMVWYALARSLMNSNKLNDILEAIELLRALNEFFNGKHSVVLYGLAAAYSHLYRFDMVNDYIDKAVNTMSQELYFDTVVPLILKENRPNGLMESLMELKDYALKWRYPDACCASSNCRNILKYCNVSKAIYYKDPSFSGFVNVICSNKKIQCSLKYHPDCWELFKQEVYSPRKIRNREMLSYKCSNPLCKSETDTNVIVKIETYDEHAKIVDTAELTFPSYRVASEDKTRELNERMLKRMKIQAFVRQNVIEEEKFQIKSPMEKLKILRENHYGPFFELESVGSSKYLFMNKLDKIHEDLMKYLYKFVESEKIVTKDSLILKWAETRKALSDKPTVYKICDVDVPYLVVKYNKLMMLGEFICIPPIFNQLLTIMETETIRLYRELENNGDQFYSRYNERILELYKEKYQQDGPSSSTDIGTLPPPTDENIIGEEFFTRLALSDAVPMDQSNDNPVPSGMMVDSPANQQQSGGEGPLGNEQMGQMNKAPSAIKSNIKAASQIHPY